MEAKRYSKSVPLQELAGKAALANFDLADDIDVWILAATVEVSEPTQRKLEAILENGGISLLTLDWTEAGIPQLALLLAAVRDDVVAWSRSRLSPAKLAVLQAGLDDIRADRLFDANLTALTAKLSSPMLGLDALRQANTAWCERHFGNRRLAQDQFSQFLAPLESAMPAIERPAVLAAIDNAVLAARADGEGDTLVAVLGGEGSGKTWAVAKWWLGADPQPVLLLSVGRIAEQLSGNEEPLEMIARLAAHQDRRRDDQTIARWRKRIERWSKREAPRERFVIFIDGLNETSGKAWSTILRALMPAARDLGGIVVATCRQAYWTREVAARLTFMTFERVLVGDYDDAEFADILSRAGMDIADLPPQLNQFMRNPRICALALTLIPQLSDVAELSVDRLLLEYWRARLQERGDLVGHDDLDFRNLLIRHAREYRARPGTDFNRDEWRSRSGAAQRADGRELINDFSDIEEGRFFDPKQGTYQFREETLHFALGLLVADEMRDALRDDPQGLGEALAAILDPIRGFDIVADVVTSAIAAASLDANYPGRGIAALVSGWMSLQNLSDDAFETLVPYIAARPDPFLDAFEALDFEHDDGRFLRLVLLAAESRAAVAQALEARIDRWLGTWSRELADAAGATDRAERQRDRDEQISARLAELNEEECAYFDAHCRALPVAAGLAGAAAAYLLGKPQARFAGGIVAFAFAYKVAGHYHSPIDNLAWALRLNRQDPQELADTVSAEVARFSVGTASQVARDAAAQALRLLGSLAGEIAAEALSPRRERSDGPDNVDPLDPAAEAPDSVEAVTARIAAIDPTKFWTHMSTTSEDHDLDRSLNVLVRFDPDGIRHILDRVGATVAERTELPLRQLGWHLPWLSPILSPETHAAIAQRVAEIGKDPALTPDGDTKFITGMMVESLLPGLDGHEQLDLLQSLPPEAPFYFRYSALAKPVIGAAARLEAVMTAHPRILERTLIFLSSAQTETTDELRDLVILCLTSPDPEVVGAAAEFARKRGDPGLDDAVLGLPMPPDEDRNWHAATVRVALANAIVRRDRGDLVGMIPVEHLDWAASQMPAALDRLADTIEDTVAHLARPVSSDEPGDAIVVLEVEEDGETRINLKDRGEGKEKNIREAFQAINEEMADTTGAKFARRQELLGEQLDRFLDSLTIAGALMIARRPYSLGLTELARDRPDRYAEWLGTILETTDELALTQLHNFGLALAQNYADVNADLATRTFGHLWRVDPQVTVTIGDARHPFRDLALFSAGTSGEIDALRRQAFVDAADDARIESLVMAAEAASAHNWLDHFMQERASSASPADQGLAITVASFRAPNDLSEELLGRDWREGFLGAVAESGRSRYERAVQAAHWFAQAEEANDPHARWRSAELGIAAADRRQLLQPVYRRDAALRMMGGDMPQRLKKAADKASSEAKKTLLGVRLPNGLFHDLMR